MDTLKTLQMIKQIYEDYLERKIDLVELQTEFSAIYSNLENDIPLELQKYIHNFIEDLEYIRFMYDQDEQFDAITGKILHLKQFISKFLGM